MYKQFVTVLCILMCACNIQLSDIPQETPYQDISAIYEDLGYGPARDVPHNIPANRRASNFDCTPPPEPPISMHDGPHVHVSVRPHHTPPPVVHLDSPDSFRSYFARCSEQYILSQYHLYKHAAFREYIQELSEFDPHIYGVYEEICHISQKNILKKLAFEWLTLGDSIENAKEYVGDLVKKANKRREAQLQAQREQEERARKEREEREWRERE